MTRTELLTAIKANLSGRTDKDTEMGLGIDAALDRLGKTFTFHDMVSTVADASIFATALTVTAGTWTEATKTLSQTGKFADYTFAAGDQIWISGGTGATSEWYKVASRTDDDAIVLSTSIGSDADGETDVTSEGIGHPTDLALPTDTYQVNQVFVVGDSESTTYELLLKEPKWVKSRWTNPSTGSVGKPSYAYLESDRLHLNVRSDTENDFRFTVVKMPSLGGDGGDSPSVDLIDQFIVAHATYYVFASMEAWASAARWEAAANKRLAEAVASDSFDAAVVFRANTALHMDRRDPLLPLWQQMPFVRGGYWWRGRP